MTQRLERLHVHGDNIVECERAVELIRRALADDIEQISGPFGSAVCPQYEIRTRRYRESVLLVLYPGFGRWDHDILDTIRLRGAPLREAADVVMTKVGAEEEEPLLAIEFCGALPAGNQAWQRNGRAYSFAKVGIPFLYVAELAGYELDAGRNRKAARLPNPAVPFSYIAYSLTSEAALLPLFLMSPGADEASCELYREAFGGKELVDFVRSVILGHNTSGLLAAIRERALSFVAIKAGISKPDSTLTASEWYDALKVIEDGGTLAEYLYRKRPIRWQKKKSIRVTPTASRLMASATRHAIGLTSKDLPMCIIPADKRQEFGREISEIYSGRLPLDFVAWLNRQGHLAICWMAGFKPGHDDARPDRGLPPLARMLVGDAVDLLTVIYGPAPPASWALLERAPGRLMSDNGLWQSVLGVSDAVIGDSLTDTNSPRAYTRAHWASTSESSPGVIPVVTPRPVRPGEHDVDTVLHLVFGKHAGLQVFEGLCNPPGGDWSGISLQTSTRDREVRWLTLPRVSADAAKRPDHVVQVFAIAEKPAILSIESKERAASVERRIGPRLSQYVTALLNTPASIERPDAESSWKHSNQRLLAADFWHVSAVAYITDLESPQTAIAMRADADILLGVVFRAGGVECTIRAIGVTGAGQIVARFLGGIDASQSHITIRVEAL